MTPPEGHSEGAVIARATNQFEAHAIHAALAQAEIPAWVIDPNTPALDEALSSSREPVLVMVRNEDQARAEQVLAEAAREARADSNAPDEDADMIVRRPVPILAKIAFVVAALLVVLTILGGLVVAGQMLLGR